MEATEKVASVTGQLSAAQYMHVATSCGGQTAAAACSVVAFGMGQAGSRGSSDRCAAGLAAETGSPAPG